MVVLISNTMVRPATKQSPLEHGYSRTALHYPIEHCWVLLKKKVTYRNPTSIPALCDAIKQVWVTEIGPEYCEKLCLTMPDRIAAVLRNSGKHTKF